MAPVEPAPGLPPPRIARVVRSLGGWVPQPVLRYAIRWLERFALLIVAFLLVPVGIVVLAVTGLIFAAVMQVTGAPSGTLGAVLGIAWLVGSLAITFVVLLRLFRALPASFAWLLTDDDVPEEDAPPARSRPVLDTDAMRALDARHAPRSDG